MADRSFDWTAPPTSPFELATLALMQRNSRHIWERNPHRQQRNTRQQRPPLPTDFRNRNQRPSRTKEESIAIREILGKYRCPWFDDQGCKYEKEPNNCKFWHPSKSDPGDDMPKIPDYICIFNLYGKCKSIIPKAKYCPNGIHISIDDLKNTPDFEKKNKYIIDKFYGPSKELECCVCLDKVRKRHFDRSFANLEDCIHCVCSRCATRIRNTRIECPLCRTPSRRYIKHFQFFGNDLALKKKNFESGKFKIHKDIPFQERYSTPRPANDFDLTGVNVYFPVVEYYDDYSDDDFDIY